MHATAVGNVFSWYLSFLLSFPDRRADIRLFIAPPQKKEGKKKEESEAKQVINIPRRHGSALSPVMEANMRASVGPRARHARLDFDETDP